MFLGDLVGRAGRRAVIEKLPDLRSRYQLDFVIVNGENAAGGFGITEEICEELIQAGVDAITTGNHVWDQRQALVFIDRQERLLRPLNFPAGSPGRGTGLFKAANGAEVLVINAMGRVFMTDLDCPFQRIDHELSNQSLKEFADVIFVDFHAEATSEKQAMAHFLDGRVTCVAGTHTHTPTSDHRVLENGSGYISDVGMCGDYNSILGMDKAEPVRRFVSRIPSERFQPSLGAATICGIGLEIDDSTGKTTRIGPIRLGGLLAPTEPDFWVS